MSAIEFSDCAPKSGRHTAYDEIRGISIVLPHQPLIHLDSLLYLSLASLTLKSLPCSLHLLRCCCDWIIRQSPAERRLRQVLSECTGYYLRFDSLQTPLVSAKSMIEGPLTSFAKMSFRLGLDEARMTLLPASFLKIGSSRAPPVMTDFRWDMSRVKIGFSTYSEVFVRLVMTEFDEVHCRC